MATLHVVSHSPFTDRRLASCLQLLSEDDGLLLCGDAVYALASSAAVLPAQRLYALAEDVEARNASKGLATLVDYPGFVALSLEFHRVNTWL